jgi:hypothetical protein
MVDRTDGHNQLPHDLSNHATPGNARQTAVAVYASRTRHPLLPSVMDCDPSDNHPSRLYSCSIEPSAGWRRLSVYSVPKTFLRYSAARKVTLTVFGFDLPMGGVSLTPYANAIWTFGGRTEFSGVALPETVSPNALQVGVALTVP